MQENVPSGAIQLKKKICIFEKHEKTSGRCIIALIFNVFTLANIVFFFFCFLIHIAYDGGMEWYVWYSSLIILVANFIKRDYFFILMPLLY